MATKKYNEFINEAFPHHQDPKYRPDPEPVENPPVKFSDVTEEMLDTYIEECKETFAPDSKSTNLINFSIKGLREAEEKGDSEAIDKAKRHMMMWYKNDLCNAKKLLCDNCEGVMEMNYTPKCYQCDESKPKVNKHEVNYFDVVRWVSSREEDFDEDDLWSDLTEWKIQGNDSYFKFHPNDVSNKNISIIAKYYDLDGLKWWVSW